MTMNYTKGLIHLTFVIVSNNVVYEYQDSEIKLQSNRNLGMMIPLVLERKSLTLWL